MWFERTEDGQVVKCNMSDEAFEVPRDLLQQKSKTVEAILRLQEMLQQLEKFRR